MDFLALKRGSSHAQKRILLNNKFLLGDELGRGACGQVFKAIDYESGETVAIKQIALKGASLNELNSVMSEIDLLKALNHKNIVKYLTSFKSSTHLYIVLEFMENGSLSKIIKPNPMNKFGIFPESLVAVYVAQVLRGLAYLHAQGVVHRDIKGANILINKDGLVKLADFGVSSKLDDLEESASSNSANGSSSAQGGAKAINRRVVGSPYWMAPEVIEMTEGADGSSCDIWGVGCLVIEMLCGSPPYFNLQPLSALFRIVSDEDPPIPEEVRRHGSPLLIQFVEACFIKDWKRRPTAQDLRRHPWLSANRHTLKMAIEAYKPAAAAAGIGGGGGGNQQGMAKTPLELLQEALRKRSGISPSGPTSFLPNGNSLYCEEENGNGTGGDHSNGYNSLYSSMGAMSLGRSPSLSPSFSPSFSPSLPPTPGKDPALHGFAINVSSSSASSSPSSSSPRNFV
eukprot:CAMPEP_0175080052 /NCGR_PEP_ID=MMETSP0052_2-20121109/25249_1 /TAXON_ID=51329 ORGANISM="Polytomella parva, Strain SAG 63-3" /NCGR_SAMPLE_ID=MMETSP0052_2 /ASSEMBLY_ACC=CAM_ASM_000194 /LENGTH=455 /DNA_ID=CAMNT_0016350621 /DNA_START=63 /DNA_END=1426 /DNA_ORIENTATION=+